MVTVSLIALIVGVVALVIGFVLAMREWKKSEAEDITETARVIIHAAFMSNLPWGYRVIVSNGDAKATVVERERIDRKLGRVSLILGECDSTFRLIDVYLDRHKTTGACELHTLLHESVHALCPDMPHGSDFDHIVEAATERLWRAAQ